MPTQKSWSAMCRERVASYERQINAGENMACIKWAIKNLSNSYRPLIFKYRCALLLRRAIKSGRIKENTEAKKRYEAYLVKYNEEF